jgi:transcriptional regulator with XRE-family HTH domain
MDEAPANTYKALREATGLTQRAVERRLGWKSGHLSWIERGARPTPEQRQALLVFYNAWLSETLRNEGASA